MEDWTTTELFDYAKDHDLVDDSATFKDWMHDRSDLLEMVKEHFENN